MSASACTGSYKLSLHSQKHTNIKTPRTGSYAAVAARKVIAIGDGFLILAPSFGAKRQYFSCEIGLERCCDG